MVVGLLPGTAPRPKPVRKSSLQLFTPASGSALDRSPSLKFESSSKGSPLGLGLQSSGLHGAGRSGESYETKPELPEGKPAWGKGGTERKAGQKQSPKAKGKRTLTRKAKGGVEQARSSEGSERHGSPAALK